MRNIFAFMGTIFLLSFVVFGQEAMPNSQTPDVSNLKMVIEYTGPEEYKPFVFDLVEGYLLNHEDTIGGSLIKIGLVVNHDEDNAKIYVELKINKQVFAFSPTYSELEAMRIADARATTKEEKAINAAFLAITMSASPF